MRIALSDPRARGMFLTFVILICAAISYFAGKACLAAAWSASSNSEGWEAAAQLEPDNAVYLERLGLYHEWDLEHRDLAEAIRFLQRAAQTDPLSAKYKLELATAYEIQGDVINARHAYEAAKLNYPISAEVARRYGSFLLRQGDTAAGFSEIRRALENDATLESTAISECWEADPDAAAIVEEALPRKTDAYMAALDYFVSQHQTDAARIVWAHLLKLGPPFPIARALPFVDDLISEDRIDEANTTWDEALLAIGWPQDSMANESVTFNGGYEIQILNGGFDWRELPADGVSFGLDSTVAHSGVRSLRIEFNAEENLDFQHIYQYVAVKAGQRYRFTAFLRTEDITTNSGMRFEIVDPRHPAELQILTPSLTGTNSWTEAEAEVNTGADTNLVEIILRRLPSKTLDNKLRGIVWVDDVALTPINGKSPGAKK
ncbi:MAG TPA: hypothetical protein VGT03_05680 [Candidatus Acidoferrales bacterium]|nr:hypothetical protein [Candidatus Acidoferrales bacterium]